MKKYRIVGLPQAPTYRTGGVLDQFAPGGAPCPRGQIRDASGKCVNYNWGSGNIQAADSYAGMYGGYDSSGVKNLSQIQASAKKGKKFSDYVLRGGKSRADVARNIGKNAGQYFGMSGEALEPVNYTKAGLDKFTKDVKSAEKNYKAEEKNRENYEKALKKKESGKMSTDKFAREYEEKGWANYDPATMKEGYEGQFQDAVDEANVRKEANMGVTNTALELLGGGAYRIIADPLGTAKGVAQTIGDVATLPVGLGEGAYNYATKGDFDMGINPLTGANYGEGVSETFDVLGAIPGIGAAGKLAKFTKNTDLAIDAGKFLTTKTPLKHTYKVLGNNSKFHNPGEVPHWKKGYQEVWDPEVADLDQLKEFQKIYSNKVKIPKQFKKEKELLMKQRNAAAKEFRNNLVEAKAKGDPELIKQLENANDQNVENYIMNMNKVDAKLDAYRIKKYSPFEEELGSGSFGKVFSIPGSNKVVKIGRIPGDENLDELIERGKSLRDRSNIAIPIRHQKLSMSGTDGMPEQYATVMNKVDDTGTRFNILKEEAGNTLDINNKGQYTTQDLERGGYEQLVQDIKDLQDSGLYVDFQNTDNIMFNPQTGKFNIYDLNTAGHYMSSRLPQEIKSGYNIVSNQGIRMLDKNQKISIPQLLRDHDRKVPLDIHRRGGVTNDYIELDIPEDKIQNYLNNGYNVEEVAVPMMADGGTPSDIWYQYTGTPWSEAKTKGLTDGSAEQNLALAKRLQAGEFGEPKIVDAKPTPTVTPYDQMVFALVKQGNTIDDLVKQKVGTKEGLIFKYPELFANKKNVSAPKKPGKKPGKGTTIMELFDALSKFISPYADEIGDAVSTAYDSWITRQSKIAEQEKKAKKKPAAPAIDLNKIFTNKIEEYKKFGKPIVEQKPVVQQKQVIQPYDIEALRAQLTQSNMAGAPPSLTRQQPQQPLGNNTATQFQQYGVPGKGIENTSLNLQPDPEVSLWDVMNKVNKDLSSKTTVEEKPPVFDNSISSQLIEQEWLGRQQKDNERYGKFMSKGIDIVNRTDVQRNVDSEKFFADIAKPNSVIIDIGSALGNSDPKLAGVSVWELTQNPKIKQKKIKVIATDIPEQVSTFKKHAKDKKAYNIDYAEVPMTYNTPIDNILKTKNLSNTKDVYLRAANSIDLLMTVAQTKEHFYNIAKKLKAKNVTYVYNNMIWYKPSGETSWRKLGNINNAAYDHNAASWKLDKNRKPYALTGDDVRNPFNN
jgi:hypothetical protein